MAVQQPVRTSLPLTDAQEKWLHGNTTAQSFLQLWGSELSSSWRQGRCLPTEPSSPVQGSTFLTLIYFYSHFGNRSFSFPVFPHRLPSHLWFHRTFKLPAEPSSLMSQKRLAEALLHLHIGKHSEESPFLFLVATGGPDILFCTLTCVVCRTIPSIQEHPSYLWIHCVKWHRHLFFTMLLN